MHDTTESTRSLTGASPWRRIGACFVDYLAFIVPLLGLLSLGAWILLSFKVDPMPGNRWLNHGMMILLLTLPIVLYFALCEASRWQGTFGKRLMRITVQDASGKRASLRQTAIRAFVKFLPWEFFHAIYWDWEGWPMDPAPPTSLQITGLVVGWLVTGWYVLSLFVGARRSPYDRLSGTIVVPARDAE